MSCLISKKTRAGFTLIELLVSIGLFTIVAFISFGSLVGLFDANNKSGTLFSAMTNLNYAVESATRDMRFADTYHCGSSGTLSSPNDCTAGDTSVAVTAKGVTTVYRWSGSQLEKSLNGSAGPFVAVTGSDINIQYARFYVVGSAPASYPIGTAGRDSQPYIILVIKGYSGGRPVSQTAFDLETLVSQRKLDL